MHCFAHNFWLGLAGLLFGSLAIPCDNQEPSGEVCLVMFCTSESATGTRTRTRWVTVNGSREQLYDTGSSPFIVSLTTRCTTSIPRIVDRFDRMNGVFQILCLEPNGQSNRKTEMKIKKKTKPKTDKTDIRYITFYLFSFFS